MNIEFNESNDANFALQWTGRPVEFIELSKALFLSKSINNGKIEYKKMFFILSKMFNVSINNSHQAYTKMRGRTEDRTIFLNKLIECVINDMDEKDNK